MTSIRSQPGSAVATAMRCAGLVTAQFIGGKAARDALYLAHLNVTTLPTMIIVTSAASIVLVAMSSKIITRLSPSRFVPALFATSAVLLLAEWALIYEAPRIAERRKGVRPLFGRVGRNRRMLATEYQFLSGVPK